MIEDEDDSRALHLQIGILINSFCFLLGIISNFDPKFEIIQCR